MKTLIQKLHAAIATGDAAKIAKARNAANVYLVKHSMAACLMTKEELALVAGQ